VSPPNEGIPEYPIYVNGVAIEPSAMDLLKQAQKEKETLHREFKTIKRAHTKLESMFTQKTSSLSKEIKTLKKKNQELEYETEETKEKIVYTKNLFDEDKKVLIEMIQEKDKLIQELKDEIKQKTAQILIGNRMYYDDMKIKEESTEMVKSMEIEIASLLERNKNLDHELLATRKTLNKANKKLEDEKNVNSILERQVNELERVEGKNKSLRDINRELEKKVSDLHKSYDSLSHEFKCFKSSSETTENELKKKLEVLVKPQEKPRIRTIKKFKSDKHDFEPAFPELGPSLLTKVDNLEEENKLLREQLAKSSKIMQSLREMIDEKNSIIEKLEKRTKGYGDAGKRLSKDDIEYDDKLQIFQDRN
jgi:myosin heavy subunit